MAEKSIEGRLLHQGLLSNLVCSRRLTRQRRANTQATSRMLHCPFRPETEAGDFSVSASPPDPTDQRSRKHGEGCRQTFSYYSRLREHSSPCSSVFLFISIQRIRVESFDQKRQPFSKFLQLCSGGHTACSASAAHAKKDIWKLRR